MEFVTGVEGRYVCMYVHVGVRMYIRMSHSLCVCVLVRVRTCVYACSLCG